MLQGHALQDNITMPWFAEYARRTMFRKLGYHDDIGNLRADEAEWLIAVDAALGQAREGMRKVESNRAKKNIRN